MSVQHQDPKEKMKGCHIILLSKSPYLPREHGKQALYERSFRLQVVWASPTRFKYKHSYKWKAMLHKYFIDGEKNVPRGIASHAS